MTGYLETAQQYLSGKSPLIAGILGSAAGTVTEVTKLSNSGNTALFVAICGLFGYAITALPKIVAARSSARMSEAEFVGARLQNMIDTLTKQVEDSDKIRVRDAALRHEVQNAYQAAVFHLQLRDELIRTLDPGGHAPPPYVPLDLRALMREHDEAIMEIKQTPRKK